MIFIIVTPPVPLPGSTGIRLLRAEPPRTVPLKSSIQVKVKRVVQKYCDEPEHGVALAVEEDCDDDTPTRLVWNARNCGYVS